MKIALNGKDPFMKNEPTEDREHAAAPAEGARDDAGPGEPVPDEPGEDKASPPRPRSYLTLDPPPPEGR